jgi:hypothetical protein
MGKPKQRVLAGRGVAVAGLAALAAACGHASAAPLPATGPSASQTPGPATPAVTPTAVPVLGPLTYGTFPATKHGEDALTVCEQWAQLRGQYVSRVQAPHTAYELEQWFSGPVWQAAFAAGSPLRADPAYTAISVAFTVATSGDAASIANARMLDRACAAAD